MVEFWGLVAILDLTSIETVFSTFCIALHLYDTPSFIRALISDRGARETMMIALLQNIHQFRLWTYRALVSRAEGCAQGTMNVALLDTGMRRGYSSELSWK